MESITIRGNKYKCVDDIEYSKALAINDLREDYGSGKYKKDYEYMAVALPIFIDAIVPSLLSEIEIDCEKRIFKYQDKGFGLGEIQRLLDNLVIAENDIVEKQLAPFYKKVKAKQEQAKKKDDTPKNEEKAIKG